MANPNLLPQPIERHPDRLIENVYPQTFISSDAPDHLSAQIAEKYLIDRFQNPPNEGRPPHIVLEPVEKKGIAHKGWFWLAGFDHTRSLGEFKNTRTLKITVASIVASIAVNLVYNREWIGDRLGFDENQPAEVSHKLIPRKVPVFVPGKPVKEKAEYRSQSGKFEYKPTLVTFVEELKQLKAKDVELDVVDIIASSSDEYLAKPDGGFEKPDPENKRLALQRAKALKTDLIEAAEGLGMKLPPIKVHAAESVLTPKLHKLLEQTAKQFGYADLARAISTLNSDAEKLPPTLRQLLQTHISDKRGVSLFVKGHTPDTSFTAIVPRVVKVYKPEVKDKSDWEIFPCFIPFLSIPKFKRVPRTKFKEKIIPGIGPDDEWMKIYDEAILADGKTLRPDSWAYTRKYQALMREDRIKEVYEAGYKDGDGDEQKLRILFIDHKPVPESLKAFEELLQSFALARDGKMTKFLNAVAVFPRENAGLDVDSPKQIGLGIDLQLEAGTLGLAFPGIGLVEMHMPTKPTARQLNEFFVGARWVFGHEVDGHFTDLNGDAPQVKPIRTHMPRSFILNDQWSDVGAAHYDELLSEEISQRRLWRIRRSLQTIKGHIIRTEDGVVDNDPRLREARRAQLENRFPTAYSRQSVGELYAEGMAQAVTGIEIPFSHQPDLIDPPSDPNFVTGYHIGTRLLKLITRHVGSSPYDDGVKWPRNIVEKFKADWKKDQGSVEISPQLVKANVEGRTWEFRQSDDERILNILVRGRILAANGLHRANQAA